MTVQALVRAGSPDPGSRRRPGHQVLALVLVAAAYYLGAQLGLSLSLVDHNVTPLWPPTGIAVAAFLLLGRSMWPGVAVAALAVNLPITATPLAAAATAAGNTAAPFVAALLLGRVGFRRQLDRQRDALAIVFLGALASMLISATTGTATLAASGAISSGELPGAWAVWWTGDAMGVLAVAPFLLCLPLFLELEPWPAARWVEAVALLVLVTAVTAWAARSEAHVLFLVLPVLGWAAWRLQLRGAAPAALIASLVATGSATHGSGPFAADSLAQRMLTLQAFNACIAVTSFFLAALVSERLRAADALAAAATERARREHQIAETLQRSLLPDRLPQVPGVDLAARYVPATADVEVGGDWYDVISLPDGRLGLTIGDVAGHGLLAATSMGQLRMAVRAYVLQDPAPPAVLAGLERLVTQLPMPEMATMLYLLFDPDTGSLRYANAGHLPAVLVADGQSTFLTDALVPPLGVTTGTRFVEAGLTLQPGATLVLYTDGLVERRRVSLQDGLDRLSREALADVGVDALCDLLLQALSGPEPAADDIALLVIRRIPLTGTPLALTLPAEARHLQEMRRGVHRWLRDSGIADADRNDVLIACGEACANAVRHAYPVRPGVMELEARLSQETVSITVRDHGRWRIPVHRGGGWGLQLMRGLMDSVELVSTDDGTEVTMLRRVAAGGIG